MITSVTIGTKLRIINNVTGHGWPIGATVYARNTVTVCNENTVIACSDTQNGVVRWNAYAQDLAPFWTNRKEHADEVLKEIKELERKATELRHLEKRLREFESDEEEIAAMMVRAMKESELSEKDAIKNLAKTLKGRLRTDLL